MKLLKFSLKDGAAASNYLGFGEIQVGYMTVVSLNECPSGRGILVEVKEADADRVILVPWSSVSQATYAKERKVEGYKTDEKKDRSVQTPVSRPTRKPTADKGRKAQTRKRVASRT